MPVIATVEPGKVTGIWGQASLRLPDGSSRTLRIGDVVHKGDLIITTQNGIVEIQNDRGVIVAADGQMIPETRPAAKAAAEESIDRVIQAVEAGDPEAATAAGAANSGGEAESALRVGRISEGVGAGSLVASALSDGSEQVPEFATPRLDDTETETTVPTANAAPTAGSASAATGENTTLESRVPPATDTDGTITGYQLIAGPGEGSGLLTFNPDGSYRFDPGTDFDSLPAGATRTVSFSYIAIDNGGAASAPATITITVTGTNDAPVAQAASFAVAEDAAVVSGSVTATDPDGNAVLTFALDGAAPAGLVFNANGTYSFDPSDAVYQSLGVGQSQVITVPYTVTDDQGATSTANLVITVTGTNDAPVAVADIATTPINTTIAGINVLGNDTDAEGDALTVTAAALANPAQGTVSINSDGTLSFTPALNVAGPVVINYTVADPAGAISSASVTVNVGANTPPAGADATLTMLEDGSRSFSAADFGFSDSDAGQTLANVRIDSLPLAGSLTYNGSATFVGQVIAAADLGNLRFVPAPDTNGANYASFTFSAQDSAGGFDPTPNTITIDVTPVADPAVIGGQAGGATVEDVTLAATGVLAVTDPDAGEAAFVPISGLAGAHGSFSIDAAGAWTYSLDNADPAVQALGAGQSLPSETFTVSTIDGTTQVVTISITGADDAPVISAGSGSVVEDTQPSISGTLTATDVDNPGLAFSAGTVSGAYGSLVLAANGAWTYALDARSEALAGGQVASDPITVTLNDGSTTTVTLSITGTNDAAVITGTSIGSVTEDGVVSAGGTLAATDIDDPATFVAATSAGTYGDFTITAAGAWSYGLRNTDANVQALTSADQPIESFTVTTADGTTQTIAVTVNGANEAPIAVISPASGLEDSVGIPITLGATDVDGSIASFTLTTLPANGVLLLGGAPVLAGVPIPATAGSATLSFVPAADWNGSTALVFTAVDNEGASSPAVTQTITVQAVNDAPVASAVSASGLEDQAARILITLAATDVDGSIASYRITTLPANGSLFATATGGSALAVGAIVSGPVYFVPSANSNGSTSFQYAATDNSGAVSPAATATIVVAPVNDAPTLTGLGPTLNYVESNAATVTRTVIDGAVVLGDIDSPNFGGGSLTVAITNVRANQDLLDVNNQGNGAGQIGVSGSNVSFGGVLIGTLNGGTAGAPLVVSLNSNATVTAVDALIQNIRYGNQAQLPDTTARTVSFTVVDGDGTANGGADTRVVTTTINVASSNDAPTFTALGGTVAYTENGPAAVLDSNATLTDPELGLGAIGGLNNMGGAMLTLVRNGGANAQDQFVGTGALVLNAGNVVLGGANVGTYNAAQLATGQLAITFAIGTTNAQASSVLQQIGYQNSSDTPPASVRINFTVNDGNTGAQGTGGARSSAISFVTVNITPFNDAPIANPDTATAGEAGGVANGTAGINPTGTVLGNDSDPEGAALTVSAVTGVAAGVVGGNTAGQYGTLVLLANGTYTYTLNNALAAVQALSPGQTLTETFNYTARDPGAATASSTLTITIQGTNDAPVVSNAAVGAGENTVLSSSVPAASDVDGTIASYALVTGPGTGNGSLVFNSSGTYSFNPGADFDALAAGATRQVSFTYTAIDNSGAVSAPATITITVTGTDDAPVISVGSGSVIENMQPSISGTLTATDVDNPGLAFSAGTVSGAYGSLVLAANGAWTYTLDARSEALAGGQVASDPITVTLSDGSTTTVTLTVTGTNDAPVISVGSGSVTEDAAVSAGNLTTGGTLTVTDADTGQATFQPQTATAGTYGSFTLAASGAWTYTAANSNTAIQALGAGQSLSETFTVRSADGTASTVTVTINGTNDAPVASAASFSVAEDATIVSGSVTATDVDGNATLSFALSNPAPAGLTFNANGTYSFNPANAAYQSLGAGQSQLITVPYTVADDQGLASTANLVVTVTGTNDAPVAQSASFTVAEDAAIVSGSVIAVDADTGAVLNFALNNPAPAGLVFNTDGSYSFNAADAAYQSLGAGQSQVITVPYTVTDDQGATSTANLVITVTGTDDAPVISVGSGSVIENTQPSISGTLTATDVDNPGLAFSTGTVSGAYGSLVLAASGAWTYTLDARSEALAGGQVASDPITVTLSDGSTTTVTIGVTGTNDGATIGGTSTAALTEDVSVTAGNVTAAGSLSVADADSGQAVFATPTALAGTYGAFTFNTTTGAWTYAASNDQSAIQQLGAGQTLTDSIVVNSLDGTASQIIRVTITGTNDAPVAGSASFTVAEDAAIVSGSVTATDVDGNATLSFALNGPAPAGLSFNADGSYSFDPANAAYQALGVGQSQVITVPYTVTDDQGTTSFASLVITVTGTNDVPVAQADVGSVLASSSLSVVVANGVVLSSAAPAGRDTDVDGDPLSVILASVGNATPAIAVTAGGTLFAGTYGDLTLRSDGSYNYVANKAGAIATGTTVSDVFSYQLSDGNGGFATTTLTIGVAGQASTITAAPPTTTTLTNTLGLNGEYYGYNDFNPGGGNSNRRHADDGTFGNLDRTADMASIVNGRNGAAIAGSNASAGANTADARWTASTLDYGASPTVTASLGTNVNVAAGGSTAGLTNTNSQLFRFLNRASGSDAGTLAVTAGTGDSDSGGTGPTAGLGTTSDAGMRITGNVYLEAGLYDIRVTADDGFRLRLGGNTAAEFDGIQAPTTRAYTGVPITGGMQALELLYWEQGGNAQLRVEFKLNGTPDSSYQVLGSNNLPIYSAANTPVLGELQDIVAGSTPGTWLLRTGSLIDGGTGDDTITGSAGRDRLIGGADADNIAGAAGSDILIGGSGNDTLAGGTGSDVFRWEFADRGTAGTPARDVVSDFNNVNYSGDVLDLRDLLVGETHAANVVTGGGAQGTNNPLSITADTGNLANYLHFTQSAGNTVIEISSTGAFGTGGYAANKVDQVITLNSVNLVGAFTTDAQVVNDLLRRGKLVTD